MKLNWNKYGIDISKQRGGKMLCQGVATQESTARTFV
jgi:hypothetical protein